MISIVNHQRQRKQKKIYDQEWKRCFDKMNHNQFYYFINHQKQSKRLNWDLAEQYTYIMYISNCPWTLESERQRRNHQVFQVMSKFIKTRTPRQIVSHHQRMMLKYNSLEGIVQNVRMIILNTINQSQQAFEIIVKLNRKLEKLFTGRNRKVIFRKIQFEQLSMNFKKESEQDEIKQQVLQKVQVQQSQVPYIFYKPADRNNINGEMSIQINVKKEQAVD